MKQLLARLRRMREIVLPFAPWEMVLMRLLCSVHFYDTLPASNSFCHDAVS